MRSARYRNRDDEDRRERDDEREHGPGHDRGRGSALAVVDDVAEVRGLLHGRTDRVANDAFAPLHVPGRLVLHATHDRG
jgi:hypothetical protein